MSPAEVRAFNAGVEAVRVLARAKVEHWLAIRKTGFVINGWIVGAKSIEREAEQLRLPEPEVGPPRC